MRLAIGMVWYRYQANVQKVCRRGGGGREEEEKEEEEEKKEVRFCLCLACEPGVSISRGIMIFLGGLGKRFEKPQRNPS